MKKLFSFGFVAISAVTAYAGNPTRDEDGHLYHWAMRAINQTEGGADSEATHAFNFLQDGFGKPHVAMVWFNWDTDRYEWRGPKTGKVMSMSTDQFQTDIIKPFEAANPQ